jgi:hypothetical protein
MISTAALQGKEWERSIRANYERPSYGLGNRSLQDPSGDLAADGEAGEIVERCQAAPPWYWGLIRLSLCVLQIAKETHVYKQDFGYWWW